MCCVPENVSVKHAVRLRMIRVVMMYVLSFLLFSATLFSTLAYSLPQIPESSDRTTIDGDPVALADSNGVLQSYPTTPEPDEITPDSNALVDSESDGQVSFQNDADTLQIASDSGVQVNPILDGSDGSPIESPVPDDYILSSCETHPSSGRSLKRRKDLCPTRMDPSSTLENGAGAGSNAGSENESNQPKKPKQNNEPDVAPDPNHTRGCDSNSDYDIHLCCTGNFGPISRHYTKKDMVYVYVEICEPGSSPFASRFSHPC